MPQITYNDWKAGLDVRRGSAVSAADRLRACKNAYINKGGVPEKRPAVVLFLSLPDNVHGFATMDGDKHMFYDAQHTIAPVSGVTFHKLTSITGSPLIVKIHYAEHFNGYLYVVAEYANGAVQHHYLNGAVNTRVTDVNCPQTTRVLKKGSRIFASGSGAGDVVRYCAGADPLNWTPEPEPTSLSAGFLPVNIQADGNDRVVALGSYHAYLVVFTDDHAQLWLVDADQTTNSFGKLVYSGAKGNAVAGMAGELFFLSAQGIRSMGMQLNSDDVSDRDVGSAIDDLISAETSTANARFVRKYGQLWVWFDSDVVVDGETLPGSIIYVYSYSKISKISAWSTFELPVRIQHVNEVDDTVLIRTADALLKMDKNIYRDFGTGAEVDSYAIEVELDFNWLDFKSPTILKQITGADFIMEGTAQFSVLFDNPAAPIESMAQNITGNTHSRDLIPVEVCSTAIAPRIRHTENEAFRFDSMTFQYFTLGAM